MTFAFVNWDIVWVAHVDMIARWFFILLLVAFFLMFSLVYFENKDKFKFMGGMTSSLQQKIDFEE